jgi:acyl dehydratase
MTGTDRRIALKELPALVGTTLGESGWRTVGQDAVNAFADATGDHSWLHVDPERARTGPYGGTIAHGFLTLALVPALTGEAFTVTDAAFLVNYGVNKVRFPAPLPVGSRVKLTTTLNAVEESAAGPRLVLGFEIRAEGAPKPAATGETVLLAVRHG